MARTSKVTRTASRNAPTRRVASKAPTQSQVLARLEALEANVANSAPVSASSASFGHSSKVDSPMNQTALVTTTDLLDQLHVTIGRVDGAVENVVARIHPILGPISDGGVGLSEEPEPLNLSPLNEVLRSAILRLESMARYIDGIHNRVSC